MAIGIIIMVLDFIYGFAAMQFENQELKYDMVSFCLFISYHWGALYFASSILSFIKLSL
jgi:hypothetical protein